MGQIDLALKVQTESGLAITSSLAMCRNFLIFLESQCMIARPEPHFLGKTKL